MREHDSCRDPAGDDLAYTSRFDECVTCANGHAPMTPTENARACDMHTIRLDRNATCPQCLRTLTTSEYGAASILANRPCLKCQITSQARR